MPIRAYVACKAVFVLSWILKRLLDVVAAAVGLLILSPVMAFVALLVRTRLGSPVLFRQERTGLHKHPFILYKFRTMTNARGPEGELLSDAERLTRVGQFLRSTSLDELPELWNVLRGDMSLVGPRPLPPRYLPYYTPEERQRHEIRPGITGWAQVNGRNETSWDDRLAMDVWYVNNLTLLLDLRILFKTIRAIVRRQGISARNQATMQRLDEVRR